MAGQSRYLEIRWTLIRGCRRRRIANLQEPMTSFGPLSGVHLRGNLGSHGVRPRTCIGVSARIPCGVELVQRCSSRLARRTTKLLTHMRQNPALARSIFVANHPPVLPQSSRITEPYTSSIPCHPNYDHWNPSERRKVT